MSKHILIHMISLSVDFYYIRNICSSLYQYIHSGILQIQRLNRFLTLKIDLLPHYFRQRQFVPPMCLIVQMHDERGEKAIGNIERFAFYDEAKTAYCIISTSEKALYANVMLQKGVVINND